MGHNGSQWVDLGSSEPLVARRWPATKTTDVRLAIFTLVPVGRSDGATFRPKCPLFPPSNTLGVPSVKG